MNEQAPGPGPAKLERAIVLELLAGEHAPGRSCADLAAAVGASQREVEEAVRRLREAGIVHGADRSVCATPAALRLDELGLIGI
jgi:DNA-binding Lrp family transcriptional regulator